MYGDEECIGWLLCAIVEWMVSVITAWGVRWMCMEMTGKSEYVLSHWYTQFGNSRVSRGKFGYGVPNRWLYNHCRDYNCAKEQLHHYSIGAADSCPTRWSITWIQRVYIGFMWHLVIPILQSCNWSKCHKWGEKPTLKCITDDLSCVITVTSDKRQQKQATVA